MNPMNNPPNFRLLATGCLVLQCLVIHQLALIQSAAGQSLKRLPSPSRTTSHVSDSRFEHPPLLYDDSEFLNSSYAGQTLDPGMEQARLANVRAAALRTVNHSNASGASAAWIVEDALDERTLAEFKDGFFQKISFSATIPLKTGPDACP